MRECAGTCTVLVLCCIAPSLRRGIISKLQQMHDGYATSVLFSVPWIEFATDGEGAMEGPEGMEGQEEPGVRSQGRGEGVRMLRSGRWTVKTRFPDFLASCKNGAEQAPDWLSSVLA